METWGIVLLVVFGLLFVYLASALILTFILNQKLFGVRGNDPSHPVYVHFEDYPYLERNPYECLFQGKSIKGYVYQEKRRSSFKGFVILSHGMFGTHLQYLVDVNYLCLDGYQVLCYDQYGVGESEGESQISLYHGILVLDEVICDVEKRKLNNALPIILYGHSWGAYCSLGVLGKHNEVFKAVLRSGPVKPSKAGLQIMKSIKPFIYYYLKPILPFTMFAICGKDSLTPSIKGYKKNTHTKILAVYAKNDPMVNLKNSQYYYFLKHPNENFSLLLTENGLHNSIITEKSYHSFIDKAKEFKEIEKIDDDIKKAREEEKFLSSLSRADMVVYFEKVKNAIEEFLN